MPLGLTVPHRPVSPANNRQRGYSSIALSIRGPRDYNWKNEQAMAGTARMRFLNPSEDGV